VNQKEAQTTKNASNKNIMIDFQDKS